ncbi:MAG: UDP-3-O-(3-hydroxymyristoyl)glucosamine N-acyltransferase [Limnohabitans sp.]|nr:UDP-3-O-(3-hydroxymyristoyl)glucosamine N-acyltransferase [Limnohabitans sp.]
MPLLLGQIHQALGGELLGSKSIEIVGLAPIATAKIGDITFLSHPQYAEQLQNTQASCVIVSPHFQDQASRRGHCIVIDNPYAYYARLTQWWKSQHDPEPQAFVHPTAWIDPLAQVHPSARIGPFCWVDAGAIIGANTWLKSHVSVSKQCKIGANCIIHSGVVIGADGFGFAPEDGRWIKIEQLGGVQIGDDVEIGANSCVDRGALEDTVIENGVKLDNLVQIGHNVHVGAHTAMAGCVGVAGSARIGAHCTIGGGAVVLGHLQLVDHVHISAASVVTGSILQAGNYTGFFPIDDNATWEKNAASLRQLNQLRHRLKGLEKGNT